ncbi:MAG: PD40 domain-containing protein, partial [Gemmatimonadetes bacterium]|nr:PD40 domain-containing protein [Gemmatimonadota bacterium]
RVTQTGLSLGTPQYMSPEQATGDRQIDARSDIYSLGAVVYEMLTGEPPHMGTTVQAVIARVLTERPHTVRAQRPSVPDHVEAAVLRALEKLPADRFATAGEFGEALTGVRPVTVTQAATPYGTGVQEAGVGRTAASRRHRVPAMVPWLTAAAAVVLAIGTTWVAVRPSPAPVTRFAVTLPPTDVLSILTVQGPGPRVALSPDGRTLIYAATRNGVDQLYRRALDQVEAVPIPGTEGGRHPFFSPDGQWLGFVANLELKKIALVGGPPITICDVPIAFLGASWGSDDRIVFSAGDPNVLFVVAGAGGDPQPLTTLEADESAHRSPSVLPGGKAVLFTSAAGGGPQIVALSLESGERRVLLGGTTPRYVSTGHMLFYRDGSVWAAPFDRGRLTITGEPVPIVEGVQGPAALVGVAAIGGGVLAGTASAEFDVSPTGAFVYEPSSGGSGIPGRTLVWVDRQGGEQPVNAPPRAYVYPRISPDNARLALDIRDQENDIWVWDFARQTLTRLTFNPGTDIAPVWTPDGRRIVYQSAREGSNNLYWRPADGTGTEERLTESPNAQSATSFSPDGRQLVFRDVVEGSEAISTVSLDGERRTTPLVSTPFVDRNGELSPDGRWLAYESNESGRAEIYVRPFPDVDQGRWQISTAGGTKPLWARNGRELFYLSLDGRIMAVSIEAGPTFTAGTPEPLPIRGPYVGLGVVSLNLRPYDVSPDGRRFLLIREGEVGGDGPGLTQLVVVLNWFEELKRVTGR